MKGKSEFISLLNEHLRISREVSKHFLKIGKAETSTIIEHEVLIIDGQAKLRTRVNLLPIRRMCSNGSEIVEDDDLMYEMEEVIEV